MKTALFSGAFNPIGKHHMKMVNGSLKHVNKIIIMPVYKSMFAKVLAPGEHRLNMCKLAVKNNEDNNVSVSDFEIKNKLSTSPINIIKKYINETNTKIDYFVMGIDNALNIDKWYKKDESINLFHYIVFNRPNCIVSSNDMWFMNHPHIFITDMHDARSSTMARQMKTIQFLDQDVLEYIDKNSLY
jgi:nicotinate-nucleotide adenylyltransferase